MVLMTDGYNYKGILIKAEALFNLCYFEHAMGMNLKEVGIEWDVIKLTRVVFSLVPQRQGHVPRVGGVSVRSAQVSKDYP